MAQLPLDPPYARVLLAAKEWNCISSIVAILAMLYVESDSIFFDPKTKKKEAQKAKGKFLSQHGDHFTYANVFASFFHTPTNTQPAWCRENFLNFRSLNKAMQIRLQLLDYVKTLPLIPQSTSVHSLAPPQNLDATTIESIKKALVTGLFTNGAILQADGMYKTLLQPRSVSIHPSSVLFNRRIPCVLYGELVLTKKHYLRTVSQIEPTWLAQLAPTFYNQGHNT
jgi:HrpA-like RNA helicase